ncbi:MAG: DsbE family thiol:disulfide interchange protein [Gammaproteobacteria bacterium]|nr:DsbE family thiol:disulfide interchange protein [Gammaproteobacteria bacterium]
MRILLSFAVFFSMLVLFAIGLKLDPSYIPSPLIGKPMPAFSGDDLQQPEKQITQSDWLGQPALINIWASWCAACLSEHPLLMEFSQTETFPIYGIDYKDQREDALQWLKQHGNPYTMSLYDDSGRAGIDWGVYGVPETFVIDHVGTIHYKHIGPIDEILMQETLIPLLETLHAKQYNATTS